VTQRELEIRYHLNCDTHYDIVSPVVLEQIKSAETLVRHWFQRIDHKAGWG